MAFRFIVDHPNCYGGVRKADSVKTVVAIKKKKIETDFRCVPTQRGPRVAKVFPSRMDDGSAAANPSLLCHNFLFPMQNFLSDIRRDDAVNASTAMEQYCDDAFYFSSSSSSSFCDLNPD